MSVKTTACCVRNWKRHTFASLKMKTARQLLWETVKSWDLHFGVERWKQKETKAKSPFKFSRTRLLLSMAATAFHMLSAVGLRNVENHKHSLPSARRFSASVTALSSEQWGSPRLVDYEQPFANSFRDYLEAAQDFIRPEDGNSPSRWFSPLESKARCEGAPLLLFLPG